MQEHVAALIPEVRDIAAPDLREAVLRVWSDAIQAGQWRVDDLSSIPFSLKAAGTSLGLIEHVRCCARMCVAVADAMQPIWGDRLRVDRDILVAGALLADVGKLLEYELRNGSVVTSPAGRSLRHPFLGVSLCRKHGLPDAVSHIVATHSFEGDQATRSVESIIFHHVDFIDFDVACGSLPRPAAQSST